MTTMNDDARPPILRAYFAPNDGEPRRIKVQLFAGGGGASLGEELATGESPDVAVNHSHVAIAMHRVNHPTTKHYIEDVFKVDPREATAGRRVGFLWLSPTCTHFSRASGVELKDRKIRGLAWSIMPWIKHARPDVIVLENVIEFLTWGPVCRRHDDDCPGDANRNGCLKHCPYGKPIKARAGETFRAWSKKIRSKGYSLEYRKLVAWEYGAPTTRHRLYIIMRADGQPADWPRPTHAKVPTPERPNRWRTAADIIDWSIPCPSIFDRKKVLSSKTEARLVRGLGKFVLESGSPFVLPLNHGGVGRRDHRVHDLDAPMPTITAECRGSHAVAIPYMVHRSNGERVVVAGGTKTAVVMPTLVEASFLAKHYGERHGEVMGSDMNRPIGTVTAQDHHALVAASLIKFYGTSTGSQMDLPLGTVTAGGWKHALSAAYLSRYNGQSIGQGPDSPIGTLDTHDRYAVVSADIAEWSPEVARKARRVYDLMVKHGYRGRGLDNENRIVVVTLGGYEYVVVDLGMRMLTPRELFRANGFPDRYIIDPIGPRGKRLTKTEQIRACGNSVCPPVAEAIVRAALRLAA